MGDLNLEELSKEILLVNDQFHSLTKDNISSYELETFTQWWGNTSGGFEGIGGSAMTQQRTYVLIPKDKNKKCLVFFGGRFAYRATINEEFIYDLNRRNLAGVSRKSKYQ